jgi:uncharacterized protein YndB with AHSA1/START domain
MATTAHTIEINASPERVWEMLTTLRYGHLWLAGVTAVQKMSTPDVGPDTTFDMVQAGSTRTAWTVSTWEPPQQLRFSTAEDDAHYSFSLEPTPHGTQVTMEYQKTGRGLGRLLPATGQRRMVQGSLARLKELITFNRDIALIHGVGDE